MRTLAIGDIHGCFKALQAVVAAAEISSEDNVVTLGDYIDRGPEVPAGSRLASWSISIRSFDTAVG